MNKDKIRQAMISARAVIHTAMCDTPGELSVPERARVLERTANSLTEAIDDLDQSDESEFTNAIAGDRDRRGVYASDIGREGRVLLSRVQMVNMADHRFRKTE